MTTRRWAAFLLTATVAASAADKIVLKDGFTLEGQVSLEANRIVVQSHGRNYFVGTRQLARPEPGPIQQPTLFRIPQPVPQTTIPMENVMRVVSQSEFDQHGRRTVVIEDERKRQLPIIQAITEVYPTHVVLEGLNRGWTSLMPLERLEGATLRAILGQQIDLKNGRERLRLVGFFIEAGRIKEARAEIAAMVVEFPELASEIEAADLKVDALIVGKALDDAAEAMQAGQLKRAGQILDLLAKAAEPGNSVAAAEPSSPDAAAAKHRWLRELTLPPGREPDRRLLANEFSELAAKAGQARTLLGAAVAALPTVGQPTGPLTDDHLAALRAAANEITLALTPATLPRVAPFLQLAAGAAPPNEAQAGQSLALAITGWLYGPALAQSDPAAATRALALREGLRTVLEASDNVQRELAIAKLPNDPDSIGLIRELLPRLPAPPVEFLAGQPGILNAYMPDGTTVAYRVALPAEYDRYRAYPCVITLNGLRQTPEEMERLWAGPAGRAGVIVVAPDWRADASKPYGYSSEEHLRVLMVVADVRRRLAVDNNRLFLSGHELGGFATWDIAMSHPDEFAGLIAFTSAPLFYCKHYRDNLTYLPTYAVEGSRNGGNPEVLRAEIAQFFALGLSTIYVEYPGRGSEPFAEELPTILRWIRHQQRPVAPPSIEATSARTSDRSFYWLRTEGHLAGTTVAPEVFDRTRVRPAQLTGRVTDNNTLFVNSSGLAGASIWLSPDLIHLDDPALTIKAGRRILHRGPITPDLRLMLAEIQRTGDRTRHFLGKIEYRR